MSVCVFVCCRVYTHVFTSVFDLFVCVSESLLLSLPQRSGILGCVCVFGCVCHGKTGEEESECRGLCLCGLIEVSNHPGLMAMQLWQSSQTPLKNSQGGLRGRMKEEENNSTIKSCRGDISGFLSTFVKSANFGFTSF